MKQRVLVFSTIRIHSINRQAHIKKATQAENSLLFIRTSTQSEAFIHLLQMLISVILEIIAGSFLFFLQ